MNNRKDEDKYRYNPERDPNSIQQIQYRDYYPLNQIEKNSMQIICDQVEKLFIAINSNIDAGKSYEADQEKLYDLINTYKPLLLIEHYKVLENLLNLIRKDFNKNEKIGYDDSQKYVNAVDNFEKFIKVNKNNLSEKSATNTFDMQEIESTIDKELTQIIDCNKLNEKIDLEILNKNMNGTKRDQLLNIRNLITTQKSKLFIKNMDKIEKSTDSFEAEKTQNPINALLFSNDLYLSLQLSINSMAILIVSLAEVEKEHAELVAQFLSAYLEYFELKNTEEYNKLILSLRDMEKPASQETLKINSEEKSKRKKRGPQLKLKNKKNNNIRFSALSNEQEKTIVMEKAMDESILAMIVTNKSFYNKYIIKDEYQSDIYFHNTFADIYINLSVNSHLKAYLNLASICLLSSMKISKELQKMDEKLIAKICDSVTVNLSESKINATQIKLNLENNLINSNFKLVKKIFEKLTELPNRLDVFQKNILMDLSYMIVKKLDKSVVEDSISLLTKKEYSANGIDLLEILVNKLYVFCEKDFDLNYCKMACIAYNSDQRTCLLTKLISNYPDAILKFGDGLQTEMDQLLSCSLEYGSTWGSEEYMNNNANHTHDMLAIFALINGASQDNQYSYKSDMNTLVESFLFLKKSHPSIINCDWLREQVLSSKEEYWNKTKTSFFLNLNNKFKNFKTKNGKKINIMPPKFVMLEIFKFAVPDLFTSAKYIINHIKKELDKFENPKKLNLN